MVDVIQTPEDDRRMLRDAQANAESWRQTAGLYLLQTATFRDEIARLTQEKEAAETHAAAERTRYVLADAGWKDLERQVTALQATLAAMQVALRTYGKHAFGCGAPYTPAAILNWEKCVERSKCRDCKWGRLCPRHAAAKR